jgi:hypothetical protein
MKQRSGNTHGTGRPPCDEQGAGHETDWEKDWIDLGGEG